VPTSLKLTEKFPSPLEFSFLVSDLAPSTFSVTFWFF